MTLFETKATVSEMIAKYRKGDTVTLPILVLNQIVTTAHAMGAADNAREAVERERHREEYCNRLM
jgi:hypothetical protein